MCNKEQKAETCHPLTIQVVDNIDLGKTHEYFKWVAKEFAGPGRVKGRPRYVMCVTISFGSVGWELR